MVLDLMLGGDLRFHLDRMGFIQEDAVRFVMAELAIALDYLHNKGIVHRCVRFFFWLFRFTCLCREGRR
jgi:serine/threonine kinase 32